VPAAIGPAGARVPRSPRARGIATVAIAGLAAILAACGIRIGSIDLRFGNIDASIDSGIGFAWTVVIRDHAEWQRLWRDHDSRVRPSRPLPIVDFGRDIVVAIFLGERPDRCHEVRVERVIIIDDSRIIVRYRELVSPVGAACAQGLSWPAVIVRIPFTDLPVYFERIGTP
jgi:hypothetical protein